MSNHQALIKCTKTRVEGLATQLEKIANTTREVEANKLEVQLRLFTKNMENQRESDRRLYKQGVLAKEMYA